MQKIRFQNKKLQNKNVTKKRVNNKINLQKKMLQKKVNIKLKETKIKIVTKKFGLEKKYHWKITSVIILIKNTPKTKKKTCNLKRDDVNLFIVTLKYYWNTIFMKYHTMYTF